MGCIACGFKIAEGAKFCQECGARQNSSDSQAVARPSPALPSSNAERRQLTVVFCDLVGSTRLSTRLDAEDLRELVADYHDVVGKVVERHGGHVAQYLGDGIVIYFGYPQAFEDSAYRAVKSALEILSGMEQLNATLQRQRNVRLDVRIGMHTGQVVVGEVGVSGATGDLAMGDTPNIAARVQDLAAPNSVVITDVTAELVARRFRSDFRGAHMLKGLPKPIKLYGVIAERTLQDEEIIAASTPLVNREQETAQLKDALALARNGQGGALLMSGAAGIGKSRIVQFARQQLDYTAEQRLEFRCSQHHRDSALNPFVEQLQLQCRFAPDDSPSLKLQKLGDLLSQSDRDLSASLPIFASLLSLPPPPGAETIDPQELKERTQQALEQWILGHGSDALLLLLFEDIHWMDPSSLDMLGRLIPQLGPHRCLLLMTCRPEFSPPWEDAEIRHVPLERLEGKHIEQIISNVGGGEDLPPALMEELIDRVDGVPIFAEELTRNLISGGPSQADAIRGDLGDRAGLSIPTSLQDTLMARLDKLNLVRGVAQIAAILGREFDFATLQDLTGETEEGLSNALTQLVDGEILLQSGTVPSSRYMFRHALLQEAAYNSLLRRRRNELHARMGEILENQRETASSALSDGNLVRMLAHHWTRAVARSNPDIAVVKRAAGYLTEVGTLELGLSGYREAESQLNAALAQLEHLPAGRERDELELTARLRLSMVYMATVGWASDQARDAFSACRDLCLRLGDRPELAQVLYGFWGYNLFRANYPRALELADEAHQVAIASGNSDLKLQTHAALANSHFWLCELKQANSHADQVLLDYDPKQHAAHRVMYGMDPGVFALMFAVWVPWLLGKSTTAQNHHEQLLGVMGELDHPMSLALALNTSCCFHVNRGDVLGALEAGESLLKLAQDCGLPVYVMFGVLFRGWALAADGKVDQVIDEVTETYRNYVTYVGGLAQTYAGLMTASVFDHAGRTSDGIKVLDNVIAIAERPECHELAYHAELVRMRGNMLARSGDEHLTEAQATLHRALDLANQRDQLPFALRASRDLVTLAKRNNQNLDQPVATALALLQRFDATERSDEWQRIKAEIDDLTT